MTAHPQSPPPDLAPPSLARAYPYVFASMPDKHPFGDFAADIQRRRQAGLVRQAYASSR